MKKILAALIAVTFLAGSAFAADTDAKTSAKEQAEKKRVEEIHTHSAKKKTKKAKKGNTNATKPEAPKSDSMTPPPTK